MFRFRVIGSIQGTPSKRNPTLGFFEEEEVWRRDALGFMALALG